MSRLSTHVALAALMTASPMGLRSFHFDREGAGPAAGGTQGGGGAGATQPPANQPNADPVATLRTEFETLRTESQGVIDAALAAGARPLTDTERADNDRRYNRMTAITGILNERARFAALAIQGDPAARGAVTQRPTDPPGRQEFDAVIGQGGFHIGNGGQTEAERRDNYARGVAAVNHYIRHGTLPRGAEQFALITTTGTSVMLPTRVGEPFLIRRMRNPIRAALAARGLKPIVTDGAEAINVPVFDDTANNATDVAENLTAENNTDPTVTGLSLGAVLRDSGTVWNSNSLLMSTGFDLLGYVEPMLESRIDAREIAAWTALLAAGTVGKTTATVNGVTYAELLDWQHSLAPARRFDGVFFVSDGLLRTLRGLVDSQNRPIYQESLRDDAPDKLLGWPLFVDESLATPATGAVSGVAASAESLLIRDVRSRRMTRYMNDSAHGDQFGLRLFTNSDFKFQAGGVRTLKHA